MGKIYQPEAIERGNYPHLSDSSYTPTIHTTAARRILEDLTEYAGQEELGGAMVYGRTAFGRTERTSDLDLLIRVREPIQAANSRLAEIVNDTGMAYGISVEANILDEDRVRNQHGAVAADPIFVDHLKFVAESTADMAIGEPIVGLLGLRDYPSQIRAFEATKTTLRFLASMKDWGKYFEELSDGHFNETVMQHALGLPTAIGRKALTLKALKDTGQNPAYDPSFYDHGSFAQGAHLAWMRSEASHTAIDFLGEQNKAYTDILEETIAGRCAIGSYAVWLEAGYSPALRQASVLANAAAEAAYATGLFRR